MAFTQGRAKIRGKAHQNLAEADRLEAGGSDPKNWKVDKVHEDALVLLIGGDAYAERVAEWRAKLAVIGDDQLRREQFVAVPLEI